MAAVQIAAAGTGNGTTAGVAVTEARCYSIHISWNGVGAEPVVTPQFSVDGTNYFTVSGGTSSPLSVNWAAGSERIYKMTDLPVTKMRVIVAGLTTGTVSAFVSAV